MPLAGPRLLYWRPSASPIPRALYFYGAPVSFVETGYDVGFGGAHSLTANVATFSTIANDAILQRGIRMPAATGNLLWTATDSPLTILRTLVGTTQSYALTAPAIPLTADTPMSAAVSSFSLSGIDANLVAASRSIVAASTSFALTGNAANLTKSGSVVPTLVQHVAGGMDNQYVTTLKLSLPNAALSGNSLILGVRFNGTGSVASVVDDKGNTWSSGPSVLNNTFTPTTRMSMYHSVGVISGTRTITITFSGLNSGNYYGYPQAVVSEFCNIIATDGAGSSSSNSRTSGSITPTAANDLIWHWGADVSAIDQNLGVLFNGTSITAGSGFTPLSTDLQTGSGVQYKIHPDTSAIAPTFSASGADTWASLAMAFKSGAAGSAGSGMRIVHVQHTMFSWPEHTAPVPMLFPSTGNLLVASYTGVLPSITIADGTNTWSSAGYTQGFPGVNETSAQILYAQNATTSLTLPINATLSQTDVGHDNLILYDIADAAVSAFDKATTANGRQTVNPGTVTFSSLTPAQAGEIVFQVASIDFHTIKSAVGTGYVLDSMVNAFDDNNPGSGGTTPSRLDMDNAFGHYVTPDTSTVTFVYGYENHTDSSGIDTWGSVAAAFKPATVNPIASARTVDWTQAGAAIATGRTKSGSTIAAYTGTSATIQNALSAAAANTYVELGAGTFNLSSALNVGQKNNVTLRGQGMSTIINFTNDGSANWYWGGGAAAVTISGSFSGASDASPPTAAVPSGQTRNWTGCGGSAGSYPRGATVLNVNTTPTGLAVGDIVTMWQSNDDANLPRAGFFVTDKNGTGSNNDICWQGAYDDHGACLLQRSVVTNVAGTAITINPPLAHQWFQTSLNPQLSWHANSGWVTGVGIENLRIVTTSLGTHNVVVGIAHAKECWLKGVGLVPHFTSFHAGGAVDYGIMIQDSMRCEVRNCWIDQMRGGGINTTTSYSIALKASPFCKIENNIINNPESAIVPNIGTMGCVFTHNLEVYVGNDSQESGFQPHESGQCYNLFEGNSYHKMWYDLFHGNSMSNTHSRNHLYGWGFVLDSYARYGNFVGNTIQATAARKTVVTDSTKYDRWAIVGYRFGYPSELASSATSTDFGASRVAADSLVSTTAFIWGDYTTSGGTQYNSSECPTGDAFMPNPVPTSNSVPASQVYTSRPSFFTVAGYGTVAWPPIGPDVVGGDYMGGRAHKLPAQRAFDLAGGSIANFDPTVYG